MKTRGFVTVGAVAVCAFAAGAFGQEALRSIGALASHHSVERYDISTGVTAGQLPKRAERVEEDREVLNVPGHYGSLVGMTGDSTATVFWFKDGDGAIRNVVVRDAPSRAVKLQCVPTARLEIDLRDQRR